LSSNRFGNLQTECPGASVEGTEILIGVLEATVCDPSRSNPGAKLMEGLTHPRMGRRRRATLPNFHAREAYARTECSWQTGGPIILAGDSECVIRLDARRLSDEVAQCFNLAKIKKTLPPKMNLRFRPIAGCPSIYHRLLGHTISTMLLVALAVVETWYLLT
jgi:hypothetical protein